MHSKFYTVYFWLTWPKLSKFWQTAYGLFCLQVFFPSSVLMNVNVKCFWQGVIHARNCEWGADKDSFHGWKTERTSCIHEPKPTHWGATTYLAQRLNHSQQERGKKGRKKVKKIFPKMKPYLLTSWSTGNYRGC